MFVVIRHFVSSDTTTQTVQPHHKNIVLAPVDDVYLLTYVGGGDDVVGPLVVVKICHNPHERYAFFSQDDLQPDDVLQPNLREEGHRRDAASSRRSYAS